MDFSPLALLAPTLFWLLPLAFVIGLLKSPWVKGYLGELLVRLFAHWRLDKQTYRRLHNVTQPTLDGTPQIDHVFLSRYGIFVVETKNLSDWISASESQLQFPQRYICASAQASEALPPYSHVGNNLLKPEQLE